MQLSIDELLKIFSILIIIVSLFGCNPNKGKLVYEEKLK